MLPLSHSLSHSYAFSYAPFSSRLSLFSLSTSNHLSLAPARLCAVIESACSGLGNAVLVDVGAGEGYLSSALSVLLGLPLVGIDCSDSNVQGMYRRRTSEKAWLS